MKEPKQTQNYYDNKPAMGEPGGLKIREHFKRGMTAFLIVAACIVCYFAFLRFDYIADAFNKITSLLRPIIYGIVIAYLLNPVMKFVEKYVSKGLGRIIKKEKSVQKVSRSIAIFTSIIFALAIVGALFVMLIPELLKSINDLIEKMPGQIQNFIDYLGELRRGNKQHQQILETALVQGSAALEEWTKTNLFSKDNILVTGITGLTTGVISIVGGMLDIIIGLIVSDRKSVV